MAAAEQISVHLKTNAMHLGFLTPEYVTPDNVNGGLANYLRKIGVALAGRGHRVTILLLAERNAQWQDGAVTIHEIKRAVPPDRFHRTRVLRTLAPVAAEYLSSRRLAAAIWRIHRDQPFDLLQASSFRAPGYALRHNGRLPVVCRVSSYSPLLRSAYGRPCRPSEYLTDWLELRQLLDADAAFAPSQFIADVIARNTSLQPAVIRTSVDVPPGAEMDPAFYQTHLAGSPYLLSVGSLSRVKGIDLLAEIIPAILQRNERLKFVFIGRDDGLPDGTRVFEHIRSRCRKFEASLHYQPALAKPQLAPVIANALGILMPSRVDNYPNACLEAQAFGIPVIGSRDSSLDEMVEDGATGFLVRNGSAASLQEGIERLLNVLPEQRLLMKARILAQVEVIRAEDRVGQLIAFYESVVARFKPTKF